MGPALTPTEARTRKAGGSEKLGCFHVRTDGASLGQHRDLSNLANVMDRLGAQHGGDCDGLLATLDAARDAEADSRESV